MPASFPLAYLLIPFAVVVFLAALFFFFNVFHIRRYAIKSAATNLLLLGYFASFAALVIVILVYLSTIDWDRRYAPSDVIPDLKTPNRIPLDF